MTHPLTLRFCLDSPLLESAAAGEHNFINLMAEVARKSQFRVEYCPSDAALTRGPSNNNLFTLTHMAPPPADRGLVFRRVYHYPFWQIENTAERWHWEVARTPFDPSDVPMEEAARFARFWRKRLFDDAGDQTERVGYIYVPLQGRITKCRSFQSCSPFEMLQATLAHVDGRPVVATLHPKEKYGPGDLYALEQLEETHPNLEISMGNMVTHLQRCDYIVTQNSSVAFDGMFFGKPTLLFAQIDFHHIAVQADMARLPECFAQMAQHQPAYEAYIWWFWQKMSINAGRPDAAKKIAARLAHFGWPIK